MKNSLFIAATNKGAGLTSVSLGLYQLLEQAGIKVGYCKPIAQSPLLEEAGIEYLTKYNNLDVPNPISMDEVRQYLGQEKINDLLEKIVYLYNKVASNYDLILVEGIQADSKVPFANRLNAEIAKALDSHIILIDSAENINLEEIDKNIALPLRHYTNQLNSNFLGIVLTKVSTTNIENNPLHIDQSTIKEYSPKQAKKAIINACKTFNNIDLIGVIPWQQKLLSPRTIDIVKAIDATFINKGDADKLRVESIQICAATVPNFKQFLTANTLIICPGDRDDVILSCSLAVINGAPIAGILLTGNIQPKKSVLELADKAIKKGMPIILSQHYTYQTVNQINQIDLSLKVDDIDRIKEIMSSIAECIDLKKILNKIKLDYKPRLSPPAFRYNILEKAKSNIKTIVLPEGNDPRIIQAAYECQDKGIANCILLGDKAEIISQAKALNLDIEDEVKLTIIDYKKSSKKYIEKLVEIRSHKGMTTDIAKRELEDPIVVATMMLYTNEVDGIVAGATTTTANTVRPALQIIKTAKNSKIVSSVFFMCLPEQVLVYGDCAINTNPSASELADIAIQSNDSAKAFGIDPKIAMISYSTGSSGSGGEVDKVLEATKNVIATRPDIIIDGPLQYDAATVPSVALKKAPNSPVAGKATVCIFPDLNTGNTTYKAVQRSANVVSIGPMLQGLRKPVNDLSRGALVEDIVYTIVLTAIQAQAAED